MTRLTTPLAGNGAISQSTPAPLTLPLAGRSGEMAVLTSALQEAHAGHGATLILSGESGIGKTRLASAVVDLALRRGFGVAVGRAYPVEAGVPHAVFSDALLPVLRAIEPSVLSLLTRGGSAELAQLFPALGTHDRSHEGTRPVRGDPTELKARLLWNFAQFLSRFAAKRPLLLVLENLQWADSSSLELLHFTARQIASDRILIVGTYNDADPRASDPHSTLRSMESSLQALGAARVLRLAPLDEAATEELVQRAVQAESAEARELAAIVFRRTRGNPFFVEETLKTLSEETSGVQSMGEGAASADKLRTLELPRTIRDAVLVRLGHLSAEARQLADLAAVIGARASHDALAFVSALDEAALLGALDELRHLRILTERSEERAIVYDFSHPILQETL